MKKADVEREIVRIYRSTLAEIDYSPFLARLEALEMLDLFFEGKQAANRWWNACKDRQSFGTAEVGPAAGTEAERYAQSGRESRAELKQLIARVQTSCSYDLLL